MGLLVVSYLPRGARGWGKIEPPHGSWCGGVKWTGVWEVCGHAAEVLAGKLLNCDVPSVRGGSVRGAIRSRNQRTQRSFPEVAR